MTEATEIAELPPKESALAVYSKPSGLEPWLEKIRAEVTGHVPDLKTKKGAKLSPAWPSRSARSKQPWMEWESSWSMTSRTYRSASTLSASACATLSTPWLTTCAGRYQGKPMGALHDVCREYAEKALHELTGEPLAPATKRNRIRYLTSAYRWGWKRHGMHDRDPAERVIAPEVRNERRYYVNRAEMLAIARACKCKKSRAAIRIAFYSGMRLSEILEAVRQDGMFLLEDTKNGEPRHVPIHPKIRAAAKVGPRNKWNVSKEFKAAATAVGMGHLSFHDLRHSAASAMINAKVNLYTVGAVLGHKSAASTQRYATRTWLPSRSNWRWGKLAKNPPHKRKRGLRKLPANPR